MPERGWNISFIPYYMTSKLHWSAPSTSEAIEVLSKEGFDGVEWMLGQHFNSEPELTRIVRATKLGGLRISNIMCWQDFVTSDNDQRKKRVALIQNYIRAAAELDIPIVNVFTGPIIWNQRYEKLGRDISEGRAWSSVVAAFSKVVESAEKNDVIVTLEAVFGMLVHDYYTIREFLGYFDSKNLGVNLDPSHYSLYGNDPSWAITKLRDKVKHVHVKDVTGSPGIFGESFSFPFLGEGAVNWVSFLKALKSIEYSGFLSLEFENDAYLNNVCDGDWRIAARGSKERLAKFLRVV